MLVIDNYDSFTYNLVQMFIPLELEIIVKRADRITIQEASDLEPDYLLVSPGPKDPAHAGISKECIAYFYDKIPILGVCLGMQCMNEVFGGRTERAPVPVHGKTDKICHREVGIFRGVPSPFAAARYHSLIIKPANDLMIMEPATSMTVTESATSLTITESAIPRIVPTAWNLDGIIMGIELEGFPVYGVQFHPESFMTEYGAVLIKNFLLSISEQEQTLAVQEHIITAKKTKTGDLS
ncbi:MAG: aminodeoxychorismate/anthranilate synthase component II [Desulfamplus sp.]|nr:aminodeoxychorismate/anthranilate synthase component II [Desulfamplus sp.]